MTLLLVALTGALGACTRYGCDLLGTKVAPNFPLGTLLVNVSGAFALGLVAGSTLGSTARTTVAVGFLGAFTTFSTYAREAVGLADERDAPTATGYAVGTVVLATVAAWLGLLITS